MPVFLQGFANGPDAPVHHVAGGYDIRARVGMRQRLLGKHVDRVVVEHVALIIDEAQNLTAHEIKTIMTRVGEGTKIVLTGDVEQIDNVYVNETSNGLAHAVEKFKEFPIAGHVTFTKGERSEVATLASKVL